jgi:hypothetical protein
MGFSSTDSSLIVVTMKRGYTQCTTAANLDKHGGIEGGYPAVTSPFSPMLDIL